MKEFSHEEEGNKEPFVQLKGLSRTKTCPSPPSSLGPSPSFKWLLDSGMKCRKDKTQWETSMVVMVSVANTNLDPKVRSWVGGVSSIEGWE